MKIPYLLLISLTLFSCASETDNTNTQEEPINTSIQIKTVAVSNLSPYNASSSLEIIAKEGVLYSSVERGICWSTEPNPSIKSNVANDKDGETLYNYKNGLTTLKNLIPNTKYYIKAYVRGLETNTNGVVKKYDLLYGDEISFTTPNIENLKVGNQYGGGIIAYILQPSDTKYIKGEVHGLIMYNTASTANWGCTNTRISANSNGIVGAGIANTKKINQECGNGSAAGQCYTLIANNCNDWYLPSSYELELIKTNLYLNSIGDYRSSCYWTSTESSATEAISISFTKIGGCTGEKMSSKGIIPVRIF